MTRRSAAGPRGTFTHAAAHMFSAGTSSLAGSVSRAGNVASGGEADDSVPLQQEANAGRDANIAGRDLTIINYYGSGPREGRGHGLSGERVPGG
jgi:hypothetical protein